MKINAKGLLRKLLIAIGISAIFIVLCSLCKNQTFAATKFPGSIGATSGTTKINVNVNDKYTFDTQVLWKNPNVFCVQPQNYLKNNSTGTIKKEHYINTETGEKININSSDDMLIATIYAYMEENKEDVSSATDYYDYLQNSSYQHLIWMTRYGTNVSGNWIPKSYTKRVLNAGNKFYQTNTVTARLPWCNLYYNGTYREAWTYYDEAGNEVKYCANLAWTPVIYEIIKEYRVAKC